MVSESILNLFPGEKKDVFRKTAENGECVQEIRLRADRPVIVAQRGSEHFLDEWGNACHDPTRGQRVTMEDLKKMVNHLCGYSMYAYEEELKQGFLSVPGGHRVGLVGQAVRDDRNFVRTLKYVSGLNIRIAHEVKGAADRLMPYLYQNGRIINTLIISSPGCGKTTLLRDIIRQVSDGNVYGKGISVGVVDDRSEIAGCFRGKPQNDVGMRTDVLDGCPKAKGMLMLIRSMSPGLIAIDELGEREEWQALFSAAYCGTAVAATMHGEGLEDYLVRRDRCMGEQSDIFTLCAVLGKKDGRCVINRIYERQGEWKCLFQN